MQSCHDVNRNQNLDVTINTAIARLEAASDGPTTGRIRLMGSVPVGEDNGHWTSIAYRYQSPVTNIYRYHSIILHTLRCIA